MVFAVVHAKGVSNRVSASPIFDGVSGLQQTAQFLTKTMTQSMAREIREIENECGVPSTQREESPLRILTRFCVYLPPFNEVLDTPTAVLAFCCDQET